MTARAMLTPDECAIARSCGEATAEAEWDDEVGGPLLDPERFPQDRVQIAEQCEDAMRAWLYLGPLARIEAQRLYYQAYRARWERFEHENPTCEHCAELCGGGCEES